MGTEAEIRKGAAGVVNSRTAHVSVCTTPVITAQPQSQTIFSGTAANLSVSASESTGEPKHYQLREAA